MKRKRFIGTLVFGFVLKYVHFTVALTINGAKILVSGYLLTDLTLTKVEIQGMAIVGLVFLIILEAVW